MTLENVTKELVTANSKLDDIHRDNSDILEYLELSQSTFKEGFLELLDFFKGSSLKELEDKREDEVYRQQVLDTLKGISLTQTQKDVKTVEGFLDSLARLGVLFGALTVVAASVSGAFVSFLKNVNAVIKGTAALAKTLSPAKITKAVTKIFDSIGDFLKLRLTAGSSAFGSAISGIVSFFKTIGSFFKGGILKIPGVKGVVDTITRAVVAVKTIIADSARIGKTVSDMRGIFASLRNVFGLVFRLVARIFAPLYTLYETVLGVWQGYKDGGFIGAIKGGIVGFFKGFIGDFLNILTGASAWIAGALGFENVEKILNEFDFNVLFKNLVDGVFTLVSDIFGWVKKQFGFTGEGMPSFAELILGFITLPYNLMKTVVGKIAGFFGFDKVASELEAFDFKDLISRIISSLTDMVSSVADYVIGKFKSAGAAVADIVPDMDAIKNFLKGVLRNVLPVNDPNASWFSIKNLVATAIPNSVYEFAGIDPKTGEMTGNTSSTSSGMGDEQYASVVPEVIVGSPTVVRNEEVARAMQQTQNENGALQSQAMSGGGSPTVNSNSTVNNMNTSNTTVVRPQVMPTRQPNSPSEMIWFGPGDIGFR